MHPHRVFRPCRRLREAAQRPDPTGVFYCIFFGGNRIPRVLYHSGEIGRIDAQAICARNWGPPLVGPKITGMFTLQDVPPNKNVVMVATGTGLAPYMSMLRTYLRENTERRFVVLHGARTFMGLGYRSELEMMQDLCDNFIYIPQISRPAMSMWRGVGIRAMCRICGQMVRSMRSGGGIQHLRIRMCLYVVIPICAMM